MTLIRWPYIAHGTRVVPLPHGGPVERKEAMATEPVKVTVYDPADGSERVTLLAPDEYLVICGLRREVSFHQFFGNGTVQMTLKLLPPEPGREETERHG
jgi:hypothetical protein